MTANAGHGMRATRAAALLGALLGAVACQESLIAPGACPEFCPTTDIAVLDTLLAHGVERDSAYRGYASAHAASRIHVASTPGGVQSVAVMEFLALQAQFYSGEGTLTTVSVDSLRITLSIRLRSPDTSVVLDLYRLPIGLDSLTTYAGMMPYFHDSLLVGSIAVPDSLTADSISILLLPDAFPTLEADSMRAAIGVRVRADSAAYVYLGSREGGQSGEISRFVTVEVADSTEPRADSRSARFDTMLAAPLPPVPDEALPVGGVPASRALFRLVLPDAVVDSADVVRATLILPVAEPAYGAPDDTLIFRTYQVLADLGGKSPTVPPETGDVRGIVRAPAGAADTLFLDITHFVRSWRGNPRAPRALLLQLLGEGASASEIRFWSTRHAGAVPAVRVTYVPLPPEEGG